MTKKSTTCNKYNVILLAYEITKGMKSIGSKSLMTIKIDNHPDTILKHQIVSIKKHIPSLASINIVLGFDKEKIKKKISFGHGVTLIDNDQYDKYGQSYAIKLALEKIHNNYPTVIISNHIILRKNIFDSCHTQSNSIFSIKNCTNQFFKIGCTHHDSNVEYLCYDLNPKWAEIFVLRQNGIKDFVSILEQNKHMMLFEAINNSIDNTSTINHYIYNNSLLTINHK
jgi:hypothetical protein